MSVAHERSGKSGPFQASKGMVICGSYQGDSDQEVYVWFRRFDSEDERVQQYKDVYESAYWKTQTAPMRMERVDLDPADQPAKRSHNPRSVRNDPIATKITPPIPRTPRPAKLTFRGSDGT